MARKFLIIFGWILVALGVLGFIPNPLVGTGALITAGTMDNIIHLISGGVFLWVAYGGAPAKSAQVLKVFGIIYLILAILGFFGVALLNLSTATFVGWFNLILGLLFLYGSMAKGTPSSLMERQV